MERIIINHPPFWTSIESHKGTLDWVDICIERSAQLPLTITRSQDRSGKEEDNPHPDFILHMEPHMTRLETINLFLPNFISRHQSITLAKQLIKRKPLALRAIRIINAWESDDLQIWNFMEEPLNDPRVLQLEQVGLEHLGMGECSMFPALERLTLQYFSGLFDQLYSHLNDWNALRHLTIENYREDTFLPVDEDARQGPLHLPLLTHLKCLYFTNSCTSRILEALRAPLLRMVVLGWYVKSDGPAIIRALKPLCEGPVTSIEVVSHVRLIIRSASLTAILDHEEGKTVDWWADAFHVLTSPPTVPMAITLHDPLEAQCMHYLAGLQQAGTRVATLCLPHVEIHLMRRICKFLQADEEGLMLSKSEELIVGTDPALDAELQDLVDARPAIKVIRTGPPSARRARWLQTSIEKGDILSFDEFANDGPQMETTS